MSIRSRAKQDRSQAPAPIRRHFGVGVVAFTILAAAALVLWLERAQPTAALKNTQSSAGDSRSKAPATSTEMRSEPGFQKLVGRWLRPDGGYVIEVKRAEEDGRLHAAYFNPSPIHVARAEASREGSVLKVFVELRDVNYPGSTYTLVYDPANDRLAGIYFQAMLRENYDVVFIRQP